MRRIASSGNEDGREDIVTFLHGRTEAFHLRRSVCVCVGT